MILNITVKPNSKVDQFIIDKENHIKVKIKAPAKEGKANKYLISYLSEIFDIPQSYIQLLSGLNTSHKRINLLADEKELMKILENFVKD